MTNLPIANTSPQPSGNTVSATRSNGMSDNPSLESPLRNGVTNAIPANSAQAKTENGLTAFGPSLADAFEPFANLLARQIDGVDSSLKNIAAGIIGIDDRPSPSDDNHNQEPIATSSPNDPVNSLAAMLLQIPQEIRSSNTNNPSNTATPQKIWAGVDISTGKPISGIDDNLDISTVALDKTDAEAVASGKQVMTDVLNRNAVKQVEFSAQLTPPSQNSTQNTVLPANLAGIQNMSGNNRPDDITQNIATPLDHPGWADDFSQRIVWMSSRQTQVAELHLNPPDLGPLNVVLKLSDNQATALFTSSHSAVRDAVENAMPKLREILADNGIMLGNTTVSDQSTRNRDEGGLFNQDSSMATLHNSSDDTSESTGKSAVAAEQTAPVRRHNGMVDTFA